MNKLYAVYTLSNNGLLKKLFCAMKGGYHHFAFLIKNMSKLLVKQS